ncbi:MAG: ABC transporter ATP-binding protein [Promethearchaeota archaeon]
MTRIIKYAKPYLPLITTAIFLLFIQANVNLALPDYLSNIVNVGIQQGGIEDTVPVALTEQEMNRTLLFIEEPGEKSAVLGNYSHYDNMSAEYDKYVNEYPAIRSEPIYVLNSSLTSKEHDQLGSIMAKPIVIVYFIKQIMENPDLATEMGLPIPPNVTDIFDAIENLLEPNKTLIISQINYMFDGFDETILHQSVIQAIRAEYELLGMNTDEIQMNYIFTIGGFMILMTLISMFCIIGVSYCSAKTATGMARDIRADLFEKVESFTNIEFDKFSMASLVTRSTNDITQIQMMVMMLIRIVFYAPILAIGGIIHAILLAPSMMWIIALAVIILISIIIVIFLVALPKFKRIQTLIDRLNLVSRENLSGMMVIRSFNKQDFEEKHFDDANLNLTRNSLFINRVMVVLMPLMMLIMNGSMVLIIWIGSHDVADGFIQVGNMMAFMQYAMQIVMSFLFISAMFIILPRAGVSVKRISEVLNTEPFIKDSQEVRAFHEPFNATIEFRNVTFQYPNAEENALDNISFTARPGETTALIGATGSGKTTLINLIPRFYEVSSGAILIDDIDIREVSQFDLREKIGYVPQKSSLFSGTISSNLYYANENAEDDIIQSAINISQASEFVSAKPKGLKTNIAQGGMNISGGQKQRLSIARALVKQAPIYILDDSFSSLDFKTDWALRKAFKENIKNNTLIIVSQRVSTIMNAEQIIVLEEGKIVGKGTHKELMKKCETYKEIALSQHTIEELS